MDQSSFLFSALSRGLIHAMFKDLSVPSVCYDQVSEAVEE